MGMISSESLVQLTKMRIDAAMGLETKYRVGALWGEAYRGPGLCDFLGKR